MTARLSLRARLTLWFSVVLAVCLAAAGVTVWTVLRHSMLNSVDETLRGRLAGVIRILKNESAAGEPAMVRVELEEYGAGLTSGESVRCNDAAGHLLFALPRTPEGPLRVSGGDVVLSGHRYTVEVGVSLRATEETLRLLAAIMLVSLPLVVLAASAGGWWLSRRALAPVDAMTREANRLGIHNLTARVPEPGAGDELDRLAQAWNRLLGRLQGAVERLARFTADASHELRSPVALIRTTAELALRQQRPAEEYRRALTQVVTESHRMTSLIEDLLALARSDEGTPSLEPVLLNSAIAEACGEKKEMAEHKDVSLTVDCGGEVNVLANAPMLRRIVVLLVDNAVKYTPPGGIVRVQTRRANAGSVVVEVCDTGPGITPAELPHIFERFWRGDPARSGGGFGLGLSLAKAIAEAHGGELEVRSASGGGAVFGFRLAVAAQS